MQLQQTQNIQILNNNSLSDAQLKVLEKNSILRPKNAILDQGRDPQSTSSKFKKTNDLLVINTLNDRG